MKALHENAIIDKYIFNVSYEVSNETEKVYTFSFLVTRCNKSDRSGLKQWNYSSTITIVNKAIQNVDPLIYKVKSLEVADSGNLAKTFLISAAQAEGLL